MAAAAAEEKPLATHMWKTGKVTCDAHVREVSLYTEERVPPNYQECVGSDRDPASGKYVYRLAFDFDCVETGMQFADAKRWGCAIVQHLSRTFAALRETPPVYRLAYTTRCKRETLRRWHIHVLNYAIVAARPSAGCDVLSPLRRALLSAHYELQVANLDVDAGSRTWMVYGSEKRYAKARGPAYSLYGYTTNEPGTGAVLSEDVRAGTRIDAIATRRELSLLRALEKGECVFDFDSKQPYLYECSGEVRIANVTFRNDSSSDDSGGSDEQDQGDRGAHHSLSRRRCSKLSNSDSDGGGPVCKRSRRYAGKENNNNNNSKGSRHSHDKKQGENGARKRVPLGNNNSTEHEARSGPGPPGCGGVSFHERLRTRLGNNGSSGDDDIVPALSPHRSTYSCERLLAPTERSARGARPASWFSQPVGGRGEGGARDDQLAPTSSTRPVGTPTSSTRPVGTLSQPVGGGGGERGARDNQLVGGVHTGRRWRYRPEPASAPHEREAYVPARGNPVPSAHSSASFSPSPSDSEEEEAVPAHGRGCRGQRELLEKPTSSARLVPRFSPEPEEIKRGGETPAKQRSSPRDHQVAVQTRHHTPAANLFGDFSQSSHSSASSEAHLPGRKRDRSLRDPSPDKRQRLSFAERDWEQECIDEPDCADEPDSISRGLVAPRGSWPSYLDFGRMPDDLYVPLHRRFNSMEECINRAEKYDGTLVASNQLMKNLKLRTLKRAVDIIAQRKGPNTCYRVAMILASNLPYEAAYDYYRETVAATGLMKQYEFDPKVVFSQVVFHLWGSETDKTNVTPCRVIFPSSDPEFAFDTDEDKHMNFWLDSKCSELMYAPMDVATEYIAYLSRRGKCMLALDPNRCTYDILEYVPEYGLYQARSAIVMIRKLSVFVFRMCVGALLSQGIYDRLYNRTKLLDSLAALANRSDSRSVRLDLSAAVGNSEHTHTADRHLVFCTGFTYNLWSCLLEPWSPEQICMYRVEQDPELGLGEQTTHTTVEVCPFRGGATYRKDFADRVVRRLAYMLSVSKQYGRLFHQYIKESKLSNVSQVLGIENNPDKLKNMDPAAIVQACMDAQMKGYVTGFLGVHRQLQREMILEAMAMECSNEDDDGGPVTFVTKSVSWEEKVRCMLHESLSTKRDVDIVLKFLALGLSATPCCRQMLLLHGDTANGKSVLVSLIQAMFGKNARLTKTMQQDYFSSRQQHMDGTFRDLNNELRYLIANEMSPLTMGDVGKRRMKLFVSAGDVVSIRCPFGLQNREFVNSARLIATSNEVPYFDRGEEAEVSRFLIMPMRTRFAPGTKATHRARIMYYLAEQRARRKVFKLKYPLEMSDFLRECNLPFNTMFDQDPSDLEPLAALFPEDLPVFAMGTALDRLAVKAIPSNRTFLADPSITKNDVKAKMGAALLRILMHEVIAPLGGLEDCSATINEMLEYSLSRKEIFARYKSVLLLLVRKVLVRTNDETHFVTLEMLASRLRCEIDQASWLFQGAFGHDVSRSRATTAYQEARDALATATTLATALVQLGINVHKDATDDYYLQGYTYHEHFQDEMGKQVNPVVSLENVEDMNQYRDRIGYSEGTEESGASVTEIMAMLGTSAQSCKQVHGISTLKACNAAVTAKVQSSLLSLLGKLRDTDVLKQAIDICTENIKEHRSAEVEARYFEEDVDGDLAVAVAARNEVEELEEEGANGSVPLPRPFEGDSSEDELLSQIPDTPTGRLQSGKQPEPGPYGRPQREQRSYCPPRTQSEPEYYMHAGQHAKPSLISGTPAGLLPENNSKVDTADMCFALWSNISSTDA